MYHLRHIELTNFRLFSQTTDFEFAPITIITGPNSSGKSSILKAIYLLADNFQRDKFLTHIEFDGDKHKLGTYNNAITNGNIERNLKIKLGIGFDFIPELFEIEFVFKQDIEGFPERGVLESLEIRNSEALLFGSYRLSETKQQYKYNLKYIKEILDEYLERRKKEIKEREQEKEIKEALGEPIVNPFEKFADFIKDLEPFSKSQVNSLTQQFDEIKGPISFDFHTGIDMAFVFFDQYNADNRDTIYTYYKVNKDLYRPNGYTLKETRPVDNKTLKILKKIENEVLSKYYSATTCHEKTFDPSENDSDDIESRIFPKFNFSEEVLMILEEAYGIDGILSYGDNKSVYGEVLLNKIYRSNILMGISELRNQFIHIAGLNSVRGVTERLYFDNDKKVPFNNILRQLIACNFADSSPEIIFCNQWLNRLHIGSLLILERSTEGVATGVYIEKGRGKVAIADLGFGITQLLPIIFQIIINAKKSRGDDFSYYPSVVCIEEPEANLHPDFQSLLADMFIDAAHKFNIQFILETHSEYLIRKFQYWTAKKLIEANAVNIFYLNNRESSKHRILKIHIKEDGRLSEPFGSGFYDEANRIMLNILSEEKGN